MTCKFWPDWGPDDANNYTRGGHYSAELVVCMTVPPQKMDIPIINNSITILTEKKFGNPPVRGV